MATQTQLRRATPRQRTIKQRLAIRKQEKISLPPPEIKIAQQNLQQLEQQKKEQAEYQSQLKQYEEAQKQVTEWEQAVKILTKRSRYDPTSPVGMKIKKIIAAGGLSSIYGSASSYSQAKQTISKLAPVVEKPQISQSTQTGFDITKGTQVYTSGKEFFSDAVKKSSTTTSTQIQGYSQINPLTQKPEYVLPSGIRVEVTPETTKAISQGKADLQVLATSVKDKPTIASETKRYQDLGYTKKQATSLAKESVSRGGVSIVGEPSFFQKIKEGRTRSEMGLSESEFQKVKLKRNIQVERLLGERGAQLPYNIQGGVDIIQGKETEQARQILSGEKISPIAPQFFISSRIAETKPVSNLFIELQEKYPKQYETLEGFAPLFASLGASVTAFTIFSPAMSTGTAGTISKQISKGKFDKLKEALAKLEKEVANKKTTSEQLKYLKEIRKTLKDPQQVKNFQEWAKELLEKEIIRLPPVAQRTTAQQNLILDIGVEIPKPIPSAKVTGGIIQTENVVFKKPEVEQKTILDIKQEEIIKSRFDVADLSKQREGLKLFGGLTTKQITKPISKQKNILDIKTETKTKQETKQKAKQKTAQKSVLGLLSLLRQTQVQKQLLKQKYPSKSFLRPKSAEKIPKKIPLLKSFAKKIKEGKVKEEPYELFGKRFGKFSEIGIAKTKVGAKEILKDFLKGTLGRSAIVRKGGRTLEFGEFNLGEEFRPSRKSPKVIVQKREWSLGTGSERREIQRARRKRFFR